MKLVLSTLIMALFFPSQLHASNDVVATALRQFKVKDTDAQTIQTFVNKGPAVLMAEKETLTKKDCDNCPAPQKLTAQIINILNYSAEKNGLDKELPKLELLYIISQDEKGCDNYTYMQGLTQRPLAGDKKLFIEQAFAIQEVTDVLYVNPNKQKTYFYRLAGAKETIVELTTMPDGKGIIRFYDYAPSTFDNVTFHLPSLGEKATSMKKKSPPTPNFTDKPLAQQSLGNDQMASLSQITLAGQKTSLTLNGEKGQLAVLNLNTDYQGNIGRSLIVPYTLPLLADQKIKAEAKVFQNDNGIDHSSVQGGSLQLNRGEKLVLQGYYEISDRRDARSTYFIKVPLIQRTDQTLSTQIGQEVDGNKYTTLSFSHKIAGQTQCLLTIKQSNRDDLTFSYTIKGSFGGK